MIHLQFPKGLYEGFPHEMFKDRTVRPTVGLLLIIDGKILMVNSRHAYDANLSNYWTVPQEKIECTDGNMICAMRRGIREEFGFTPSDTCFHHARILGDMENHLPQTRRGNGIHIKCIRFVGVQLPQFRIALNTKENHAHRFVSSWDELDEVMEEVALRRVQKYMRTCEMVLKACACGLLSWKVPKGLQCECA